MMFDGISDKVKSELMMWAFRQEFPTKEEVAAQDKHVDWFAHKVNRVTLQATTNKNGGR